MTHEDKIIEEFKEKFEDKTWGYVEQGVDEPWETEVVVDWLRQTLTTYRAQVLEEEREKIEQAHMAGYYSCCGKDASYSEARNYYKRNQVAEIKHPTN